MSKRIISFLFGLTLIIGLIGQGAVPEISMAASSGSSTTGCGSSSGSAKDQVLGGVGATGSECNSAGVTNTVAKIVSLLSYVAGAIAVIMVIYSGFKYITSGGDSNKVSSAKSTLIYAIVGLIIAALAQLIVGAVIQQASNSTNSAETKTK